MEEEDNKQIDLETPIGNNLGTIEKVMNIKTIEKVRNIKTIHELSAFYKENKAHQQNKKAFYEFIIKRKVELDENTPQP